MKFPNIKLDNEHLLGTDSPPSVLLTQQKNIFNDRFSDQYAKLVRKSNLHDETDDIVTPNGIFTSLLAQPTLALLTKFLAPYRYEVYNKVKGEDFDQYDRAIVFQRKKYPLGCKVQKLERILFSDQGFAKKLIRHKYKLQNFTLHYSTPGDSMHYQVGKWREPDFRQASLARYKHLQLHFDPEATNIKSIIYLSEVSSESDGPFSYIEKSNQIHQENIVARAAGAAMCGVSLLQDSAGIQFFRSLPAYLRYHNIIGSLLQTSEINTFLLESSLNSEVPMLGQAGTYCLFDPVGLHRGGMCDDQGSRLNLQLIFSKN